MDLNQLRSEIDILDEKIVNLINQRARFALQIGEVKHKSGIKILDENRERQVLKSIEQNNQGPLSNDALVEIYRAIIDACRNIEENK